MEESSYSESNDSELETEDETTESDVHRIQANNATASDSSRSGSFSSNEKRNGASYRTKRNGFEVNGGDNSRKVIPKQMSNKPVAQVRFSKTSSRVN